MKRLSEIGLKFNFSYSVRVRWSHGIKLSAALFIIFISVSYCFRENVLQKVEHYQSDETAAEVPFYVEIISVSPAAGAADVSLNSHVDAVFNDNIDMLTVDDAATFTVNDGAVNISGSFVYDTALKNIEFTPSAAFSDNTTYTVTLTTGIKNMVGESMAADYSWTFTTVSSSLPEIYVLSPLSEMFSVDTYDFGSLTAPVNFTIGNSGTSGLNISDITLSGINSSEFNIVVTPAVPKTIAANTFQINSFTLTFNPSVAGSKSAIVTIFSDDADEPSFIINLTAFLPAVIEPEIQITNGGVILVSPDSTVDFGTVAAGDTETITLIMYNIGSANLTIPANGVSVDGTNHDLFSTDFGAALTTVIPGATKSFNVSFSSPSKINARAAITFQNNDSDEAPFTIKLKARVK